MKKLEYVQNATSLYDGVNMLAEELKPYLDNGGEGSAVIMVCGVRTKDGGFTRHVFGGDITRKMVMQLLESLPILLSRIKEANIPCDCPECRATGSATLH